MSEVDKLRNVRPGDPISAEQANLIRRLLRREVTGSDVFRDSAGWHIRPQSRPVNRVLVRNDSGFNLGQFAVLGIDDPVHDPDTKEIEFKDRVHLKGIVPTVADHTGRFVILLKSADDGEDAVALVSGVVQVQIAVQAETDTFADVAEGITGYLRSGRSGAAQILWRETGTGTKWAIVQIGLPHLGGEWVRLTAETGGGVYTGVVLARDAVTELDPVVTLSGIVKEVNGVEGIPVGAVDVGTVVWAWPSPDDPDEYRFAYERMLDGTADKQMLAWDHTTDKAWELILPDEVWIDVDLATGKLKHIGPGAGCYAMEVCGWIYTDELGHVRCWTNGILSCGACT